MAAIMMKSARPTEFVEQERKLEMRKKYPKPGDVSMLLLKSYNKGNSRNITKLMFVFNARLETAECACRGYTDLIRSGVWSVPVTWPKYSINIALFLKPMVPKCLLKTNLNIYNIWIFIWTLIRVGILGFVIQVLRYLNYRVISKMVRKLSSSTSPL